MLTGISPKLQKPRKFNTYRTCLEKTKANNQHNVYNEEIYKKKCYYNTLYYFIFLVKI